MERDKIATNLIGISILGSFIFVTGVICGIIMHEVGHYVFAYFFNKSIISNSLFNAFIVGEVKVSCAYNNGISHNVFECYSFNKGLVVSLMGFIFQSISFAALIYGFKKLFFKLNLDMKKYAYYLILGAISAAIIIATAPLGDFKSILDQYAMLSYSMKKYLIYLFWGAGIALYFLIFYGIFKKEIKGRFKIR